ncbi:MAG: hypothetical protein KAU02_01775 [Tenericutes bacterium]|nr:hypothetical protein [Mycoplasmatota bacterium]
MRRHNILGTILLVIGVVVLLNALDIWAINIFFDGWWTLFLIIPAVMSMSRQGMTSGNLILLVLGVGFLLNEQIGWELKKYFIPAIFIVVGLAIIFKK